MKKLIFKTSIYIGCAVIMGLSACKKYLDVNDDPNNPSKVEAANRIVGAITTSSGASQWRGTREIAGVMQYAGIQSTSSGGYAATNWRFTSSYFLWQNAYVNTMPNSVDLINLGQEEGNNHFVGVGKVLLALNFGLLTSQYGDIVVDDYYNGKDQVALVPKFNDQKTVYERIQTILDEAIAAFNAPNNKSLNAQGGDIIYKGDVSKWIKFAWALKARYYNHLSKKSALYDANKVIDACSKAFDADGMDAEFAYLAGAQDIDKNPWSYWGGFDNPANPRYFSWSQFFVNMLTSLPVTNTAYVDPRISKIMTPAQSDGQYRGTAAGGYITEGQGILANGNPGDATKTSPTDYGRFSKSGYYTNETSPFGFISYAEVKFIEAEARLRKGGDAAAALLAYEAGVKAHMRKMGVSATDIAAYWAAEQANDITSHFTNLNQGLSHIMRQKYIALCLNPETWVDMRRMNYSSTIYGPSLKRPLHLNPVVFDLANSSQWIQAMCYESNEQTRNPQAVGDNSEKARLLTPLWIQKAE